MRTSLLGLLHWCAAVLAAALTACDGGSSGHKQAQPEPTIPAVVITFPPDHSWIGGVASVTVSGSVADSVDGNLSAADIDEFTVNGVPAQVNFANGRWQATIPAAAGTVAITAQVRSASGQADQARVSVENSPEPPLYELLRVSRDGNSALVYGSGALRRVDLASGAETTISTGLAADGVYPQTGIRTDETENTAFMLRNGYAAPDAYAINLSDGGGSSIGGLPAGIDPCCKLYPGFDVDPLAQGLVFSFYTRDFHGLVDDHCNLSAIALASGEVTTIADTTATAGSPGGPAGPFCAGPVVVDATRNRAIVASDNSIPLFVSHTPLYGLYAYDLATGEGQTLSDAEVGSGPPPDAPRWLFRPAAGDRLLAVDDDSILWVDLDTGDRTLALPDPNLPGSITDMDYDEAHQRLVIATGQIRVTALDLASGDSRELLALDRSVGSGPELPALALNLADSTRHRLYVIDDRRNRLLAVDLDTLARDVVATDLGLDGPGAAAVSAATLDEAGSMLYYYLDAKRQFMGADVITGAVRVIAGVDGDVGPGIPQVYSLAANPAQGVLYAAVAYYTPPYYGLLSIDIATGASELLPAVNPAPDPAPDQGYIPLEQILYDAPGDRVVAVTAGAGVVSVDVHSGAIAWLVDSAELGDPDYLSNAASIAWDSVPQHLLVQGIAQQPSYGRAVQSIDLATGQRGFVKRFIGPIGFDQGRALMYGIEVLTRKDEPGRGIAVDRYSGAAATVARPR